MPTLADHLVRTAAARPEAEAVRFRGRSLDYGTLDRAVRSLAVTLSEAGVRPGDRVGIWAGKSPEAVIALHAVLRCGAAYVPVDPAVPPARAAYILRDCGAACLVTDADRLALLEEQGLFGGYLPAVLLGEPAGHGVSRGPMVRVPWREAIRREGADAFGQVPVAPDDLAYVLYTSGSTGAPKGVMLSHRNARVFVDWAVTEFGVGPGDRLSSHAPFHFDLSVFDVFAAAASGACLVLVPEQHRSLGVALNRLVAEEGITVWYSVPGALVRMLDARNSAELTASALRTVLFAGEAFPLKHLRRLARVLPDADLFNLYGPTETNVCTFHQVTGEELAAGRTTPLPIGRPCPYATVALLDAEGLFLPDGPGVEGELSVTGDSVMLGYWGSDLDTDAGRRTHRTGDLARSDGEGRYTFVGRRDHMVKIRGHRVEPEEIEALLLQLPEVHEAVCLALPGDETDAVGTIRLEALVVPAGGAVLDEALLRRHCQASLPRYMVPSAFRALSAFPRTSTGKTDRRALAEEAVRCPPKS